MANGFSVRVFVLVAVLGLLWSAARAEEWNGAVCDVDDRLVCEGPDCRDGNIGDRYVVFPGDRIMVHCADGAACERTDAMPIRLSVKRLLDTAYIYVGAYVDDRPNNFTAQHTMTVHLGSGRFSYYAAMADSLVLIRGFCTTAGGAD